MDSLFFYICNFRAFPWMWLYMALLMFLLMVVFLIISCHWLPYKVECDGGSGIVRLSMWCLAPKSYSQFKVSNLSSLMCLSSWWPLTYRLVIVIGIDLRRLNIALIRSKSFWWKLVVLGCGYSCPMH